MSRDFNFNDVPEEEGFLVNVSDSFEVHVWKYRKQRRTEEEDRRNCGDFYLSRFLQFPTVSISSSPFFPQSFDSDSDEWQTRD